MKKFNLAWVLIIFFISYTRGQDDNNVFSLPKYNYFARNILFFNEYLDTDDGSYNTTDLRFLKPIGDKSWNLRVDLPLVSANTERINKTGLGDISTSIAYIPFMDKRDGVGIKAKIYANTAVDPAFGSGKWVFSPSVYYGHYFDDEQKFLIISDLEYQTSFAGSSNRSDISSTTFENSFYWFFGKNWIAIDAAIKYNHCDEIFQNNAYLELGRKIANGNMIYVHPSFGFGGNKTYNYGIECGIFVVY